MSRRRNNLAIRATLVVTLAAGCLILAALAALAAGEPEPGDDPPRPAASAPHAGDGFEVPPPPFSEGVFPCSECHDNEELKPNPERRELEDEHTDIELHHDEEHRWCLDCHDADNRDHLRLASGKLIEFSESYRLCGQCHGDKYRDWRAGVHGKRSGMWNGKKKYLLCAHCHNPHRPRFQPVKPLPPPKRPAAIR